MKVIFSLLGLISLTACSPNYVYLTKCQKNIEYTKEQQKEAYISLMKLPNEDPLVTMLMDYSHIRDANRACLEHNHE